MQGRSQRIGGEELLSESRREFVDTAGRILTDSVQQIDQIVIESKSAVTRVGQGFRHGIGRPGASALDRRLVSALTREARIEANWAW